MPEKQVRIRNVSAEILLIKAFTACGEKGRAAIIDRVTEDHFGSKVGKLVWKRVTLLNTNRKLPYKGGWNALVNDPVIQNRQTILDVLEEFGDSEVSKKSTFVLNLIDTLDFFRQKRNAYKSIEEAYNKLAEADDQSDVSEALVPIISAARTVTDVRAKEAFFRLDTLNLLETLRLAKANRGSINLARTLWTQFDAINSGLSFGSLVTVAATTSGGKSAVAFINMMTNFALQGLKVAGASLEMSKEQITERQTAFVSGVPMHKIRSGKWTPEEEKHINKSSQLLLELIAKRGGSYWVLKQLDKDSSITEMLTLLYEKGPHVILIDYINLLRLPSGKDKWEALGEVAREAKVFADSHNCIVILLAQLNDDERVKYSKAVEEHSDNVLVWSYPPLNRPGYIQVKQIKARNQVPYNFYLVEDFANMRVYDLLEPIGLALMLSRSSGKSYQSKTNEYFGVRRLIEMQDVIDMDSLGIPKHKFIEDIDWSDLTEQSPPPPNVPDVSDIMGMVREMINYISSYEPFIAKAILDNLKNSDILKPYEDIIEDIDLPNSVKTLLGLNKDKEDSGEAKKKRLLEKIQQDFLTATQDLYVEGDKAIREDRKSDRTTNRKKTYETTHEQIHNGKDPEKALRRRNKRKEVVDPEKNNSKWARSNKGYLRRQQLKVNSTPQRVGVDGMSPLDAMNEDDKKSEKALARVAESKDSIKVFKKHWKKLLEDTPPSTDTIKEHMLIDGGPEEPEFLLGFDSDYMDGFERNIELVGYHLLKKTGKIEAAITSVVSDYFASKDGRKALKKAETNEKKLNNLAHTLLRDTARMGSLHVLTELDRKQLPSVEDLISPKNKKLITALNGVAKKFNTSKFPLTPLVSMNLAHSEKESHSLKKLRSNGFLKRVHVKFNGDKISESPFIVLFRKPKFIGSIGPNNIEDFNSPEFFANTIKSGVLSKILNCSCEEREKLLRSIAWALINPEYRDNFSLLEELRYGLMIFAGTLKKNTDIWEIYR